MAGRLPYAWPLLGQNMLWPSCQGTQLGKACVKCSFSSLTRHLACHQTVSKPILECKRRKGFALQNKPESSSDSTAALQRPSLSANQMKIAIRDDALVLDIEFFTAK